MGHHINSLGQFQSDKYPGLPPDRILLSFSDPHARTVLERYAYLTLDRELAFDIMQRIATIKK